MKARLAIVAIALAVAWRKVGVLGVALVIVGVVVWYVGHCVWFPLADCIWCSGRVKRRSKTGGSFRKCKHCNATGERVRIGRRVYDLLAGSRHRRSR